MRALPWILLALLASPASADEAVRPHWLPLLAAAGCDAPEQVMTQIRIGDYAVLYPLPLLEAAVVCQLGEHPRILVIPFYGSDFACPTLIEGEFVGGGLDTSKAIVDLADYAALDDAPIPTEGRTTLRSVLASVSLGDESHLICVDGHWMSEHRAGTEEHVSHGGG